MNTLYAVILFLMILVLYLLLQNENKKNREYIEHVYEIDYTDKNYFQKVCSTRVPVVVKIPEEESMFRWLEDTYEFNQEDVKVYEFDDYFAKDVKYINELILPFDTLKQLIHTDNNKRYLSKNNQVYVQNNPQFRLALQTIDKYIKPHYSVYSYIDLMYASPEQYIPYFTHFNTQEFLMVVKGSVTVELTNDDCLYIKDNINENLITMETWNTAKDMEHLKEIKLFPGSLLYIPKYFWYRWKSDDKDTILAKFSYITPLNALANSFEWSKHFVQMCNKHHQIADTNKE